MPSKSSTTVSRSVLYLALVFCTAIYVGCRDRSVLDDGGQPGDASDGMVPDSGLDNKVPEDVTPSDAPPPPPPDLPIVPDQMPSDAPPPPPDLPIVPDQMPADLTPPDAPPPPPPPPPPTMLRADYYYPTVDTSVQLDVLFVIDNSGSMAEEQVMLTQSFPDLLNGLTTGLGGLPDLHIGVVSADLGAGVQPQPLPSCEVLGGDGAKLQNTAKVVGCTPPTDPWISHLGGVTNVPGAGTAQDKIADAFSCIAKLGTNGCGFEWQLEAARKAVDPAQQVNPGFIRNGATLAVIFVTDEDDCSAKNTQLFDPTQFALTDPLGPVTSFRCFEFGIWCDINDRNHVGPRNSCVPSQAGWLHEVKTRYVDFFRSIKAPSRLFMAAIAGPTTKVEVGLEGGNPTLKQSCQSANGIAVPAIRIKYLIDAMAPDSEFSSICDSTFAPAMQSIGQKINLAKGLRCLGDLVDIDAAAGLQADCQVKEMEVTGMVTQLPACTAATGCSPCPCWRVVNDPACGATNALQIERSGPPPAGALIHANCYVHSK